MTSTISNIGTEITTIISSSKSINSKISEEERINKCLDHINLLKTKIVDRTNKLENLDDLLTQITWLEVEDQEEEKLLREVIEKAKKFHSKLIRNYATMKKDLWQKNICREEIENYKYALDDFEDSVFEVEEIFFYLRKDDEFNDLINSFQSL